MLDAGIAFVLGFVQCSESVDVCDKGKDCEKADVYEKGNRARGLRKLRSEKAYHGWASSRERRRRSGNLS